MYLSFVSSTFFFFSKPFTWKSCGKERNILLGSLGVSWSPQLIRNVMLLSGVYMYMQMYMCVLGQQKPQSRDCCKNLKESY